MHWIDYVTLVCTGDCTTFNWDIGAETGFGEVMLISVAWQGMFISILVVIGWTAL